jgi:uncharacterized protein YfaS (alpha-2-macroglobulin family)
MSALRILSISIGLLFASIAATHASTDIGLRNEEPSGRAASIPGEPAAEQAAEIVVAQRSRRRGNSDEFELTADLKVEPDSEAPRVCLKFSQPLKAVKDVNYGDYVRFEPKIASTFIARGKRLCVEGAEHGKIYKVTVLKGLPAASGKKYMETEDFTVSVPDRNPTINFGGAAYILPRGGKRELAVNSVNVDKANISVVRINDRNLIQEINNGRINRLLNRYDAANIAATSGEHIWKGTLDIDSKRNRKVTTAFAISDILQNPKPGIYAIVAMPAGSTKRRNYGSAEATQWFVVSDLGLSTYRGADGLHVFVRSLASAKPAAGVKLRLIARNNEVLGSVLTDSTGAAAFAPGLTRGKGGARPAAVMASAANEDFNFHDISRPAFDLTDRGVGGRGAPGPIDAYLYTDRGVYRPGETVHLVALLRDDKAVAVNGPPLLRKLFKPNGTEYRKFTLKAGDQGGGHQLSIALSSAARTGQWSVRAYVDPKGRPVGSIGFKVEDFAPERMEVALKSEKELLEPNVDNSVEVDARFLYGAPAANLAVEGEIVLQQDMNPYPKHRGFKFGLVQETWRPKRQALAGVKTDAKGKAKLAIRIAEKPDTSRPLRAVIRASVSESGGRAVSRTVSLPVRSAPFAIGIRPTFGNRWVGINTEAGFDVIALGHDGVRTKASNLAYELIREDYDYRWYYRGNRWGYKVLINETPLKSGKLSIGKDKPKELAFRLKWGRYRVEVHDRKTGVASSVRFQVGWFASAKGADVPDKLEIALDKEKYRAGDTARIHIQPPFAGEVLLTVSGARLYAAKSFAISKEGKTVELAVERDWDAGAYVTATVFRPADKQTERQPARAIGVAWLARDFGDRTLAIEVDAPEKITPRQTIKLNIAVDGVTSGQQAHVTVAAVDEGILQLTRFKTPAPDTHYFGKRRLAVELRDDYGRLIKSAKGQPGRLRQGGDAAAAKRHLGGLDASSIKTVALFSGRVRLDSNGRASIPLAIPDFNGRLRLMVVAYDRTKVGHTQHPLTVRDQLVSQLTLPRFLAPRDKGRATLSLHNVDGADGDYHIEMKATGAARIAGDKGNETVKLARDGRRIMRFGLEGAAVGVAQVSLSIKGPKGFSVDRNWELAVRPAQAVGTEKIARRLDPGQGVDFTRDLIEKFVPGTGEVLLSFSRHPDFDMANLLKSLSRYPYGCAEQTTSRAMPLLYVSDVAKSIGVAENDTVIRTRVQNAIGRLLSMQRGDGSFGMWTSRGRREDWLSAYVMDFMTQAKKKGYLVPEFAYKRGMQWLRSRVASGNFRENYLPVASYAHYVLASAKQADMASLRYFHDTYLRDVPTMLGRAQIGAALALHGDRQRAETAFASTPEARSVWRSFFGARRRYAYYGSDLREAAGVVYLAAVSQTYKNELPNLVNALNKLRERRKYLSTQEKAWMLLVAAALQKGEPMEIALNGDNLGARAKPFYFSADGDDLTKGVKVENRGGEALWQTVSITGVPADDLNQEESGFTITREFYSLDGKRADLEKVRQSDVLVAVINGEATTKLDHQALIVDLLPAGFEIENERLTGGRASNELGWLPKLTKTRHTEKRDDRYVAAVNLHRRQGEFSLAYIVRAVTPGTFRMPAVYVEDMYKPEHFARSQMATVTILPR